MSPGLSFGDGAGLRVGPRWVPGGQWFGLDLVPSGLKTAVGRWGGPGWPGPVGRWEQSVGSGRGGWWPGTLLSY